MSKKDTFYIIIFLFVNFVFALNSNSYLDHEQYGYWYFNKLFLENFTFPEISRSPLYVIYLSLFNWARFPYNMFFEAILSNFIVTVSLFYLFKEKISRFYLFLILITSICFLHNLIPYTQSIAFALVNFAILLRLKKIKKYLLISYILIISATFFRNTYLIIFFLFIFFDFLKLLLNIKKFNFKTFSIIIFSIFVYLFSSYFFESRIAESKYNNGYFNDLKWSPTKSKSNTDIAFILNYNYLFLEKNLNSIDFDNRDFYFSNKILFSDAQTLIAAIKNNPKFFAWGLIKNLTHIPAIVVNKFTLRNLFPKCSNGHSCLTNYFFISISSLIIVLFLSKYFLTEYLTKKKKLRHLIEDDYLIYGIGNLLLLLVTALAMPKMRYMMPFLYFFVPLIISFNFFLKDMLKSKFLLNMIVTILIFSFSFFQMSLPTLNNLNINIKNNSYLVNLRNYSKDMDLLSREIKKCKTILVDTPTMILSFTDYKEDNLKTFFEIPPFSKYSGNGLNLADEMFINCILSDSSLKRIKGQNRGVGPNYDYRRKNYLLPFMNANNNNLLETIKFNNIGELIIYKNKY